MERLYERVVLEHFSENRQMLFLTGPRQVGKTTTARMAGDRWGDFTYVTWDNQADRKVLLAGPDALAPVVGLQRLRERPPLCILDEIHKYRQWRNLLKGFFDSYPEVVKVLVTGSARLEVFRAGGDSLMGRYSPCRIHPLSVAEFAEAGGESTGETRKPVPVSDEAFDALMRFGGFPEPFLRSSERFWNRWRKLRSQQLLREDLRDLTRIQEIGQVEALAEELRHRVGGLTSFASLATAVNASPDSVGRWLKTLEAVYYCFSVRPWTRNVTRSLRKEPKYYLWDWSHVPDRWARGENLVASALQKAVHLWTDLGLGELALHFVRDKQKREVDFLVTRDQRPWFLVEAKSSGSEPLSSSLEYFQRQLGADHAFQAAVDLPFVARDCFEVRTPVVVPARTLLSQLV